MGNTGDGSVRAGRVSGSGRLTQRTLKDNQRQEVDIRHPTKLFVQVLWYKREDGIFWKTRELLGEAGERDNSALVVRTLFRG